jgi:hypothetical protein
MRMGFRNSSSSLLGCRSAKGPEEGSAWIRYDRNPQPARVPLSDGAAEVVAVGSAVKKIQSG